MKKFNKIISGALAALMIFTSVPVYAVNDVSTGTNTEISTETEENTSETISNGTEEIIDLSEISTQETATTENPVIEDKPTVFVESDENLEETDNWELGLVFYDSTVENGTKPLTEINWDASDGGYDEGEPRVITVQINYKNTNAVTTYQPGDLKITIPNIAYGNTAQNKNSALWEASVIIGANDSTHKNYPWNFNDGKATPSISSQYYYFYNAETIEEKSNFEGSIQIEYTIIPDSEDSVERFENTCIHSTNQNITYQLSYKKILDNSTTEDISLSSNSISFNYTRTYTHTWTKYKYSVTKQANKISSYDGLSENPEDYIWVKYSFRSRDRTTGSLTYGAGYRKFYDKLPEECVVYDGKGNLILPSAEDNTYIFDWEVIGAGDSSIITMCTFYVGYPKSIYNEQNNTLEITNTVDMYGDYSDGNGYVYLDSDTITINLTEFEFSYTGDLYSIRKTKNSSNYHYSDIMLDKNIPVINQDWENYVTNDFGWSLGGSAIYTGKPMTVRLGDDLLYITDSKGNYRKLNDSEYCFTRIKRPSISNGNNVSIAGSCGVKLYVRYANTSEYVEYTEFDISKTTTDFTVAQQVVGYYFEVEDSKQSIIFPISGTIYDQTDTHIYISPNGDIADEGYVYNFGFLQVYTKDENGNLERLNDTTIDNYSTFITKENIAQNDINTYGEYQQRACAYTKYNDIESLDFELVQNIYKKMDNPTQNAQKETFSGKATLTSEIYTKNNIPTNNNFIENVYLKYPQYLKYCKQIKIYDLLPEGMELQNTEEEIIENISISNKFVYSFVFNKNGDQAFNSNDELLEYIKKHMTVKIKENWNDTNRTYIAATIDFSDYPLTAVGYSNNGLYVDLIYDWSISYDSYLEHGKEWTNIGYLQTYYEDNSLIGGFIADNGSQDKDAVDINENGDSSNNDKLSYSKATKTISSVVSTHQDLQVSTISTLSNYSTGTVPAEYGKDYSYKLRVRTGQNDVTNLIIYDNLEKWAKDKDGNFIEAAGKKKYWQGEFLGIDTSYAESKGYNVKVWYSEDEKAGTLAEDSSWKEYIGPTLITDSEKTVTITSPNWPNNYPANMTETNNYWAQSFDGADAIQMIFDSASKLESAKYDYLCFYDREGNNITNDIFGITAGKIGGSDLAGKTVIVPGDYVKITMRTDGSSQYKGFSAQLSPMISVPVIDDSKIKSLAFQYLDTEGNPAVLPANSLTYVEINMKAPADEDITTLAYNGCWTQWNALDEFDRPVDFITGINSNIVKVALPNSVIENEIPSIQLNIEKEIQGTQEAFESMQLDPDGEYQFMISLVRQEENEDGSHDVINGIISNKKGIVINDLSYGTWLITESDDTYFDLVEIISMDDPEIMTPGVTFEKTDAGYMLTIDENIDSATEYSLKVINEIEPKKYYEDKDSETNIFKGIPIIEEQSLVDKLINIFE